jgi:hypothetical protein
MGSGLASPADPLWGQQPMGAQESQDPFAADVHAMLAAQPGPDLAIPLAGERRCGQDLADQLQQLLVADKRRRPGTCQSTSRTETAGVNGGAWRLEDAAHHCHR